MADTHELPKTLVRRCCPGKTCTTTLHLDSIEVGTAPGEPPLPTLYRYLRGNGNGFGPDWSTRAVLATWVEASAAEDAAEAERQRAEETKYAAYLKDQEE